MVLPRQQAAGPWRETIRPPQATLSLTRSVDWPTRASWIIPAVILASVVAYYPFLFLPFISDDYIQIDLARKYGHPGGWLALATDALYRCRATSLVLSALIDHWFGLSAFAHSLVSILLHAANCLLIAAFGFWKPIGWRVSAIAAIFFAVHEGHQEAVVWVAALPELLVFFFALAAIHCWLVWLHDDRFGNLPLVGAMASYVLALLSKESGVSVVPLVALAAAIAGRLQGRVLGALAAMSAVAAVYTLAIFDESATHLHLNDGTFHAAAPFWFTLVNSSARVFWIWGFIAIAILFLLRTRGRGKAIALSVAWTLIALLPYAFLTYMDRVPSRHTYWASMGIAMLAGMAGSALLSRYSGRLVPACFLAAVLVHNIGYLWVKKIPQYDRRAQVTERFVDFARKHPGPIVMKCFPYGPDVASSAAKLLFDRKDDVFFDGKEPAGAASYCDTEHP